MIEISVNGLKKSFEIGNNILDGITFQIESGERSGGIESPAATLLTAVSVS